MYSKGMLKYPPGLGGAVQVSVAGIVVVVVDDLIQTQTAECLTIYGTCENKLLYMYYTTTILRSPFNMHQLPTGLQNTITSTISSLAHSACCPISELALCTKVQELDQFDRTDPHKLWTFLVQCCYAKA